MRTERNVNKGFTLVEVIVVLVILAILAAILIPSMTGWIDKAKEKRLIVACRTCVVAAHTLLVEEYGANGTLDAPDSADIVALAGVKGTATVDEFFKADEGQIHKLTYSDGTDSVLYDADACNSEHKYFIFHAGGGHSFENKADMDAINGTFVSIANGNSAINSGAVKIPNSKASAAVKTLKEAGIDLSALGAKYWMFKQDATLGNMFAWTNKDISTLEKGDSIVVMQYRIGGKFDQAYSVWTVKVDTNTKDGYNFIVRSNGDVNLQEGTTYEKALEVYNEKIKTGD